MIIIVMEKLKNRLMQLMRMLFVVAILIILIVQLLEAIRSMDIKNVPPEGDFTRVETNVPAYSSNGKGQSSEESWLDSLLNILKSYHRGE